jgi:ELWxxDGT repeat protein
VVFLANTAASGAEPWVTNGTAAGTVLLRDVVPGAASSDPNAFTALGDGRAVFAAGNRLWITDGTPGGTSLLKDVQVGLGGPDVSADVVALGEGKALFMGSQPGGATGNELWFTDGTEGGTVLLRDINPGPAGATASFDFGEYGDGQALFSANDGSTGLEPWISNGTAAGTLRLGDLNPGAGGSSPEGFLDLDNNRAIFRANGGAGTGVELYVTDGTAGGTALLRDISPGAGSSLTQPLDTALLGPGRAVFAANDGSTGLELWVTDGTAAGTSLVRDINPGAADSQPASFTVLGNGRAVFAANDGSTGLELWITDGTAAGTTRVADLLPGPGGSGPEEFTALEGGRVVFRASNGGANGLELWITDGTAAGTTLLRDINPGPADSDPGDFELITPAQAQQGAVFNVIRGGVTQQIPATVYSGPVNYLQFQLLGVEAGEIAAGTAGNDFLNLLGGDDAANGGAGDDVLDGGTGSNFLTGGAGREVFFLDGRGGQTTWATITDWGADEELSVWGWRPGVSTMLWVDRAGAAGFEGVTMHADLDRNGVIDTSVTWTGTTRAQLPTPLEFDGLLWFT